MSAITRWELGAYAVSGLLMLSELIVLPVVRAVDPRLAVALNDDAHGGMMSFAYARPPSPEGEIPGSADPWGRPWRQLDYVYHSVGPDGVDARGAGDDVDHHEALDHPLRALMPRYVQQGPRSMLVVAGLVLAAWTVRTRSTIRAPRVRWTDELRRAAFMAVVPALAGVLWVFSVRSVLDWRFAQSGAGGVLQVAPSIAIPLTWALICYLPALAWRLSRPRPEAPLT